DDGHWRALLFLCLAHREPKWLDPSMAASCLLFLRWAVAACERPGRNYPAGRNHCSLLRDPSRMAEQEFSPEPSVGPSACTDSGRVVVRADAIPARLDLHRSIHYSAPLPAVPFE